MNSNSANTVHQIEVILDGLSILFDLGSPKHKGSDLMICKSVAMAQFSDTPQTKQVRIQRLSGNDDWGIKSLHIQSSPTSKEYEIYALDENEPRFWMHGDTNACPQNIDSGGLPCCSSDEWCDLKQISGKKLTLTIDQ